MHVCDRCRAAENVEGVALNLETGAKQAVLLSADLCDRCLATLQRALNWPDDPEGASGLIPLFMSQKPHPVFKVPPSRPLAGYGPS